jgi:hypothetical protein
MNTAVNEETLQSTEFRALQLVERIRALRERIVRERARAALDTPSEPLVDAAEWDAKLLFWRQMRIGHCSRLQEGLADVPDTKDAEPFFEVPFGPEWELKTAEAELYGLLCNKVSRP